MSRYDVTGEKFSFNINLLSWFYTSVTGGKRQYKGKVQIDSHMTLTQVNLLLGKRLSCEMKNSVPEQMKDLKLPCSFPGKLPWI